ncbi:MAG: hypothetical protein JXR34_13660 [Bacteroidales bacterium]|nr:hypothetical protein [Bacteroidales bacterium]
MKILKILFAVSIFLSSCVTSNTIQLPYYKSEISYFESSAAFFENGNIKKCRLADEAKLNGFHCVSWIHFFENGQIRQFQTAIDISLDSVSIPAKSILFFDKQDHSEVRMIYLSQHTIIQGVNCKGGEKITTSFYPNMKLRNCFLVDDQEIQGFPCKSSLMHYVSFYENGKIKSLTLSRDLSIGEMNYSKGSYMELAEDGSVKNVKSK